MSDILKEAIADAKAVRETALQNAKMALEEAFTPQLKSMLSAKLKEDEFEDEEDVVSDEPEDDEAEEGRHEGEHEGAHDDEEAEEVPAEDAEVEDDDEEAEEGRGFSEEEVDEDSGLDLEAIIRELEAEIAEELEGALGESEESEEPVSEGEHDDDDDDKEEGRGVKESEEPVEEEYEIDETVLDEDEELDEEKELDEEVDEPSGIGKGTGRGNTDRSSAIGKGGQEKAKAFESVQAELKEYKEAVVFLKDKLHEVNILNAKLLFTNKLFKEFVLDNNQKLKIVENFDRAQTVREIKLVYATLCESFSDNSTVSKTNTIRESKSIGGSSKSTGSTKPEKKIITEEEEVAARFRKLAGLIK